MTRTVPVRVFFVATERGRKTLHALQRACNVKIDFFEIIIGASVLTRIRELGAMLRCLMGKNSPDVVLWDSFSVSPYLLGKVARRRGIYNFVRLRGDVWTEVRGKLQVPQTLGEYAKQRTILWIATRMIRECDLLLPVSQFLGDRAVSETGINPAKYRPLSTYIDTTWFAPDDAAEQAAVKTEHGINDKCVILTITNFNYWDKVEPLLHFAPVYRELVRIHPNLIWVIGGRGTYLTRFQTKLAANLDRETPLLQPGWLNAKSWIRACDLFLYFTGLDGLPNVAIEAGAAGKVVIANPHPAMREIIRDQETGFLIDSEDHSAVYTLTNRLLTSPALRQEIGTAARIHIQEQFSVQAVAARFCTILDEIT
ncbi:MAG: glycosyltransferase family 4 protein [Caldilineaceae bacterium]|nr:glycosyltransferase family 4 protein [Caldilineaceae bacterium]